MATSSSRHAKTSSPVGGQEASSSAGMSAGQNPSSASSSMTAPRQASRSDQVVHRFYIKTVGALVEGRLTHYGHGGKNGDKKKDKWFNLTLPEVEVHRSDLQIYRSVSTYASTSAGASSTIPPLLIAFILDIGDLPPGQALIWSRDGVRYTLDPEAIHRAGSKGKGKERDSRAGIILERWTLQAGQSQMDMAPESSSMAPHTAYRLGVIHFRALYSLVRLLPAYKLFRKLRRANNGLRMGIKLWGPEGYSNSSEELLAAWEVMERDLVSLNTSLADLTSQQEAPIDPNEEYSIPHLDMFGNSYSLKVEYRPDIDFHVEDMESVLSEKFVDMDEDWFTPTMARHRMQEGQSATASASARPGTEGSSPWAAQLPQSRKSSAPTAIPTTTSPIPQRQMAAAPGSFGSPHMGSLGRIPSGPGKGNVGSAGSGRWGILADGLPFAGTASPAPMGEAVKGSPSSGSGVPAGGAAVAARRLSGHSIHPFNTSSPSSSSQLRSTPPSGGAGPVAPAFRPGSSVGRTSSFLSQSGRSFTHAQLANMTQPVAINTSYGSGSPPARPPISPSSLSFTKQPIPRTLSSRPPHLVSSSSSPFIPGSLEKEGQLPGLPSPTGASQMAKRYSSSLSQRQSRFGVSTPGSHSSGEGSSLPGVPGQASYSLLRRTSTRTSQESGLRYSAAAAPGPDDDDIQAFLKMLDALPQPPSVAAQAVHASRSHLPSNSSSLSGPSFAASPSPLHGSRGSPGSAVHASQSPQTQIPLPTRTPMTKAQVDDALKRMAGSFNTNTSKLVESITPLPSSSRSSPPIPVSARLPTPAGTAAASTPAASSTSNSNPSSVSMGLLTASRPSSAGRLLGPSEVPKQLESRLPRHSMPASPAQYPLPESPNQERPSAFSRPSGQFTARSLPGPSSGSLSEDTTALAARITSPPTAAHLTPQTTGTSTATNESKVSRRGPVLLRGGFESRSQGAKPSTSSSPSHSPIRDFGRLGLYSNRMGGRTDPSVGNGQSGLHNYVNPYGSTIGAGTGVGTSKGKAAGQRTAPSSFGGQGISSGSDKDEERGRRVKRGPMSDTGADELATNREYRTLGGDW